MGRWIIYLYLNDYCYGLCSSEFLEYIYSDGYSDFYKKDITLNILGPVGDVVGEWIVKGAYVKTATFGDYSWADESYISISMTIAMDYAVLNF